MAEMSEEELQLIRDVFDRHVAKEEGCKIEAKYIIGTVYRLFDEISHLKEKLQRCKCQQDLTNRNA